jgi:hypothetical protein
MEAALVDSAVRKLKAKNRKEVTLVKRYFTDLALLTKDAIASLATFKPGSTDTKKMRAGYEPLYKWVATQLTDIYGFPVDYELLSGVKFSEIDLVQGVIEIEVKHTFNRVTRTFTLRCNDEAAPYSTNFAKHLTDAGGQGNRFAQLLECV